MVLDFGLLSSGLFPSSDASGSGMGAESSTVIWNDVGIGIVPIGTIVAWCKTLAGCPPLIPSFVECNGQVLADGDSPFNGLTMPNLNGTTDATKMFLRGAAASGGTGGTGTHNHGGTTLCQRYSDVTVSSYTNRAHIPPYYEVVWVMRIK